jgi:tRNA U55 pseudouridine synthase TruB
VGEIEQVPPRYAAVKVAGRKLYEYARENIEIVVEPRPVTVYSFELGNVVSIEAPSALLARAAESPGKETPTSHFIKQVPFKARVSSGTYVRSLARDLGRELGCGGYLMGLSRSAVGKFELDEAMPYELLTSHPEQAEDFIVRGAAALDTERFSLIKILRPYQDRLLSGQPLHEKMMEDPAAAAGLPSGSVAGIASEDGALLAMVQSERFDVQRKENPYDSRFAAHFKAVRIFPGGLR